MPGNRRQRPVLQERVLLPEALRQRQLPQIIQKGGCSTMKVFKKFAALSLAGILAAGMIGATVSAAGDTSEVSGSHVFMFKSVGNAFGVIMYDGFSSYME